MCQTFIIIRHGKLSILSDLNVFSLFIQLTAITLSSSLLNDVPVCLCVCVCLSLCVYSKQSTHILWAHTH